MFDDFLSYTSTDTLIDHDFKEWHKGIPYYGFWCILINDDHWLEYIRATQTHLEHFFLPGYARQAHVTLSACGLLDKNYFSNDLLTRQIDQLKRNKPRPFELHLSHLDSFTTAAYLGIRDTNNELSRIKDSLQSVSSDSEPACYKPHITLGFYRDFFSTQVVVDKMKAISHTKLTPIVVEEIHFCRYQTSQIQGHIEVLNRVSLK